MKPQALYKVLLSHYGKQLWWPVTEPGQTIPSYKPRKRLSGRQKLEICIGAILTQNTDWKNVMKALENLNRAGMMDCGKIAGARQQSIATLVKPSGYYNRKAKKVKAFCKYLQKKYNGSISKLLSKPIEELRSELLSLHGIGNETADDIILYAAEQPSFVVDAYTTRFVKRFFGRTAIDYVEVKGFFEQQLPKDAQLFNEFHALLVEHGKRYCRREPQCGECFLAGKCEFQQRK